MTRKELEAKVTQLEERLRLAEASYQYAALRQAKDFDHQLFDWLCRNIENLIVTHPFGSRDLWMLKIHWVETEEHLTFYEALRDLFVRLQREVEE